MPSITDWVKAKDATITINGVVQYATTASYRRSAGEVDRSNLRGNGEYDGTTDIITSDLSLTVAVSAAAGVSLPDVGQTCPASYVTTGGKSHSGTLLITSANENAGARGGYDFAIQGKMVGPTTNS